MIYAFLLLGAVLYRPVFLEKERNQEEIIKEI